MKRRLFIPFLALGIGLLLAASLPAQEGAVLPDIAEELGDAAANQADWLQTLWSLRQHPLDLNRASAADFLKIPFLSARDARRILSYRRRNGKFTSLDQLQQVPGVDQELFEALRPFLTVGQRRLPLRLSFRGSMVRQYPGNEDDPSPFSVQQRLSVYYRERATAGVILDKDAGETNWRDFQSVFLEFRGSTDRWRLLAGDFRVRFGGGLVFWSPYGMPVTAGILQRLPASGATAGINHSSAVNGFLRGMWVHYNLTNRLALSGFYSVRRLDATADSSGAIRSLANDGFHRTPTEIAKAGILQEQAAGIIGGYRGAGRLQMALFGTDYRPHFLERPNDERYLAVTVNLPVAALQIGAEAVLNRWKFPAQQIYLRYSDEKIRYQVIGYYYHPAYFALHGRALGAFSQPPENRFGAVFQVQVRLRTDTRLLGFAHFYRKIRGAPADLFAKRDFGLELQRKVYGHWLKLQGWQKYRLSELPPPGGSDDQRLTVARITYSIKTGARLSLQTRAEIHWARPLEPAARYYGTNLYQQIVWRPGRFLTLWLRWSVFDAPDYDLRIYEFEPDLPGTIRVVTLSGAGTKSFAMLRLNLNRRFSLYVKYQQRIYPGALDPGVSSGTGLSRFSEIRTAFVVRR